MRTILTTCRGLSLICVALLASAATPNAIDRGPLTALAGTNPISVTIALALPGLKDAEQLEQSLYTPGDPQFHKFLTADQFVARFAPSDADVAKVIAALAKYGLTVQRTTATTLNVTGMPSDMERAFSVSLHSYEVAANGNVRGYIFHAPLSEPTIPAEITAAVAAIAGLDSRPVAHPHTKTAAKTLRAAPSTKTGNPFGSLTVADFANYYNVQPLYKRGVTGSGRTIGILTLAAFTPSDAFDYWKAIGLSVAKDRIKIVNVDGGPGAPSDASGSDETALDVEQSGGIAPGAKIIVYQAPNTNQGFVDLFAKAIDANQAESLSTSWGAWEWLQNYENAPVTDPITGKTVGTTRAIHELLLRAAIQGQSTFAAAGDGGAYDANDSLGCLPPYSPSNANSCTLALSVDYPASDSLITAGGGTTLPGLQEYCLNTACTDIYKINLPRERVWGWDYLNGLCRALGYPNPIACQTFPGGGGGGVSIMFRLPWYQLGVRGTQLSQPRQDFVGEGYSYALPPFYPGRNVPDISFNADPDTGYVIFYTSDVYGFIFETGEGGTSFVGPQLNGVTALLGQYINGRVGLLNPLLYGLELTGRAYGGPAAPLRAIKYGDNWFYHGGDGYNPGAGLGTMDVANFAELLRSYY